MSWSNYVIIIIGIQFFETLCSYNGREIESCLWAFDWHQFWWPWTTVTYLPYIAFSGLCVEVNDDIPNSISSKKIALGLWNSAGVQIVHKFAGWYSYGPILRGCYGCCSVQAYISEEPQFWEVSKNQLLWNLTEMLQQKKIFTYLLIHPFLVVMPSL